MEAVRVDQITGPGCFEAEGKGKMNRVNLQKLIDFLKKLPPKQFDMRVWAAQTECGTVCCVAGWAAGLSLGLGTNTPAKNIRWSARKPIVETAQEWLGLDWHTAEELFCPEVWIVQKTRVEDAVAVLEEFRDTGCVSWRKRMEGRGA